MCTDHVRRSHRRWTLNPTAARARTAARAAGRPTDDGVSLIEVLVAFVILMVALVPLSYLFTTSLIQAGQAKNQQTALSIAEGWAEVLSNTTPPVNPVSTAVIVDTPVAPSGPWQSSAATTVTGTSVGKYLNAVSSVAVTSTANFAPASVAVPQSAFVVTGTGTGTTTIEISFTSTAGNVLTCATNPCNSSASAGTNPMSSSSPVTETEVSTPTETRGGTTYNLAAEYEWATVQNSGIVSTTYSGGSSLTLPASVVPVTSIANFTPASSVSPQTAKVTTTSNGVQTITYTGTQASPPGGSDRSLGDPLRDRGPGRRASPHPEADRARPQADRVPHQARGSDLRALLGFGYGLDRRRDNGEMLLCP